MTLRLFERRRAADRGDGAGATSRPARASTLRGQASWIVCEKICIPEEAPVALSLPVSAGPVALDPRSAPLIAAARRIGARPEPVAASFTRDVRDGHADASPRAAWPPIASPRCGSIRRAGARSSRRAPQRVSIGADAITLAVARGPPAGGPRARRIDGVLVVAERLDGGIVTPGVHACAPSRAARRRRARARGSAGAGAGARRRRRAEPDAVRAAGAVDEGARPSCSHAGERPAAHPPPRHRLHRGRARIVRRRRRRAASRCAPAASSSAGASSSSRRSFVTLLALVLFAVALEPVRRVHRDRRTVAGAGHALAGRAGYAGSFFTGALATVAATPCTAPFMGAAVGYAVTQPWLDGAARVRGARRSASRCRSCC